MHVSCVSNHGNPAHGAGLHADKDVMGGVLMNSVCFTYTHQHLDMTGCLHTE